LFVFFLFAVNKQALRISVSGCLVKNVSLDVNKGQNSSLHLSPSDFALKIGMERGTFFAKYK